MVFDYSKLKGRIVEKFKNQQFFAKEMGWSERTMSLKMQSKVYWKQNEILKALKLLELELTDIPIYFFVPKVQNL